MSKAIRTHNPGVKAEIALILVSLVLLAALAFTLPPTATTGDPAIRATSAKGSSVTNDPYVDRHAEVVARYHQGSPR